MLILVQRQVWKMLEDDHTISARLYRRFNIADALDCNAVLVVAIDELVLELANLVDQNPKLVGHIRYIVIASLAPNG